MKNVVIIGSTNGEYPAPRDQFWLMLNNYERTALIGPHGKRVSDWDRAASA